MSITQRIKDHLADIEKTHGVTIIHAIESGSRSWGFPSPDSDYDVRFVYAHPKDWYLQVFPERDVIEVPISDELDIAGWDVKKAMQLAAKGNVVIHEWLNTPLVYHSNQVIYQKFKKIIDLSFNPQAAYHHYRSMAKRAWLELQDPQSIKLKRFFYFMRALLSAQWVVHHQSMPSVQFEYVLNHSGVADKHIDSIKALIELKSSMNESETSTIDYNMMSYVYDIYEEINKEQSFNLIQSKLDWNPLFCRFVKQLDTQT